MGIMNNHNEQFKSLVGKLEQIYEKAPLDEKHKTLEEYIEANMVAFVNEGTGRYFTYNELYMMMFGMAMNSLFLRAVDKESFEKIMFAKECNFQYGKRM